MKRKPFPSQVKIMGQEPERRGASLMFAMRLGTWPSSFWRESAIMTLESHGIATVGRYGRWVFQGIADSIRDGLRLGAMIKK